MINTKLLKKSGWMVLAIMALFFIIKYFVFYYTHSDFCFWNDKEISNNIKIEGEEIFLSVEDEWQNFKVSGVTIRGNFVAQAANRDFKEYEHYINWFGMISEMNANTIKVETTMRPDFYRAFYDYNTNALKPLYLFQGVTISQDDMGRMKDAFSGDLKGVLTDEALRAVDIIHGSSRGGEDEYTFDVSDWTLAYVVGKDWNQDMVIYTDDLGSNRGTYNGEYIYSWETASAFESLLAEVGDKIFSYETNKYGQQRLLGYGNCARTDALFHDSSWSMGLYENLASINFELIAATEAVRTGLFIDYHVEPNYPQFLSFDPEYINYMDENGERNPFRAYIEALNDYHRHPIVISDFGVPSARGIANIDAIRGYNQGNMDEKEQGEVIAKLYKDIMAAGTCGGIIGFWSDDWSQKVWNRESEVDQGRGGFWGDVQNSRQSYGLLAIDSGRESSKCLIDGDISEWTNLDYVLRNGGYKIQANYDEKYMYFHLQLPIEYQDNEKIYIPIDITPNSGTKVDCTNGLTYDRDMDFVIDISGENDAKIQVHEYYNSIYPLYGNEVGRGDVFTNPPDKKGSRFELVKQISRKSMFDESGKIRRAIFAKTGKLKHGNSNPDSADYDSLADYIICGKDVEIRIPWGLLNFYDPSRMMVYDDYYEKYGIQGMNIDKMYIGLATRDQAETVSFPSEEFSLRGWDDSINWHTRLKASYYEVQKIFLKYS